MKIIPEETEERGTPYPVATTSRIAWGNVAIGLLAASEVITIVSSLIAITTEGYLFSIAANIAKISVIPSIVITCAFCTTMAATSTAVMTIAALLSEVTEVIPSSTIAVMSSIALTAAAALCIRGIYNRYGTEKVHSL